MGKIKKLDKNLVNQIAAGEVIDRPSAVVKELVENSIDAKATKIEVEIANECRDIRVADNGSGIDAEDIELAFSPHATSKIYSQDDLWNLDTLGFRGEALASIISVSRVICTSRTLESICGTKVQCENSQVEKSETGCAIGTIMEIRDLFYNTPVRLKFLKSERTEYSNIIEILQNIAISHPEVAITLKNAKTTSLKTTGSNDLATALVEIYAADLMNELKEVSKVDKLSGLKIKGFVSTPEFVRSNRKAIYIFVNGRVVKCPTLLKSISLAYEDMIPRGKHPFAVLSLSLPKSDVDVNVHPTKREIRYVNGNQVFNFVYSAVKSALQSIEKIYQVQPQTSAEPNIEPYMPQQNLAYSQQTYSPSQINENVDFRSMRTQVQQSAKLYEPMAKTLSVEVNDFDSNNSGAHTTSSSDFRVIGQLQDTYILLETKDGLQLIDQHIAHERFLYEQLLEKKEVSSQLLLVSDKLDISLSEKTMLQENQHILEKYGYKLDFEDGVSFRKLPQLIAKKNPQDIIQEILKAFEGDFDKIGNDILISTACQAAVKANTPLSTWQMKELVEQWLTTKNPQTCPHGRVISHMIPMASVASFFGRQK